VVVEEQVGSELDLDTQLHQQHHIQLQWVLVVMVDYIHHQLLHQMVAYLLLLLQAMHHQTCFLLVAAVEAVTILQLQVRRI
jgi:hypothetical protein